VQRPIILTQHGYGAAGLISLAQWERILERLEDLDDAVTVLEARLTDQEPPVPLEDVLAELVAVKK
jgi:PHD/YefM family antitoxin component YafN of YafNO toxin-antitoxin module